MMNFRDKETLHSTKQEEGDSTKASTTGASSSRQWSSGLKNPRIVRVSRSFGGKDRHSKVCTIKGLRDRRIRLSVPTAIQLYDLQDRLGLSQPSKVIDWLLDTTKQDIDKLPPLPAIPGNFSPFTSQGYGPPLSSSTSFFDASLLQSRREDININSESVDVDEEDDQSFEAKLKYWDPNAMMRSKQKGVINDQGAIGDSTNSNSQISAQNFFPIASSTNNSTIMPSSTLLSNHHPMLNYYHSDPSNLSLTQLGNLGLSSQHDHPHQGQLGSSGMPSSLALSSGSQLYICPSMSTPSLFPPQYASFLNAHHQVENEMRQMGRFHLSHPFSSSSLNNSSGLGLKPFPFSMSHHPHLHPSDANHHDKNDDHGPWKDSSRN